MKVLFYSLTKFYYYEKTNFYGFISRSFKFRNG